MCIIFCSSIVPQTHLLKRFGDLMIIQYIPVCPMKETKGFIKDLNTEELRDESERID